ncbi:hypothetical protein MTO96_047098, partial [Rhipicephalus appendiculatus]
YSVIWQSGSAHCENSNKWKPNDYNSLDDEPHNHGNGKQHIRKKGSYKQGNDKPAIGKQGV